MNSRILSLTFGVLISLGLLFGCKSSQSSTNGTTYTRTVNGSVVQVTEDEYHIHMPTSFPGGVVTFHITNLGEHSHNFKIKGNGVEQQLPSDLKPGMTADMTATLTPGTYHVICPLLGHADLGMQLDVTVTQ